MATRWRPPTSSLVDYGVIGDLTTAALVSKHGGLDWLCFPRLDGAAVFAALLDEERGGRLRITPSNEYQSHQSYVSDTNVLRTTFTSSQGRAELVAFMPIEEIDSDEYASHEVH